MVKSDKKHVFNSPKNIKIGIFIAIGCLFVITIGFVTGAIPWTAKYIECGSAPVINLGSFEGPDVKYYPGDEGYKLYLLSSYECMTSEEKADKIQ